MGKELVADRFTLLRTARNNTDLQAELDSRPLQSADGRGNDLLYRKKSWDTGINIAPEKAKIKKETRRSKACAR